MNGMDGLKFMQINNNNNKREGENLVQGFMYLEKIIIENSAFGEM